MKPHASPNRDRVSTEITTLPLIETVTPNDQDALAEALLEGNIGGAGIDVFYQEPADCTRPEYQLPNFIVTPHTSGQTDETVRRRCQVVIDNARRLAAGDQPLYTVDASMGLGKS